MRLASSFEKEVFKAQNRLRTNPRSYIKQVRNELSYFDGKSLNIPGYKSEIITSEGDSPWYEAIGELKA